MLSKMMIKVVKMIFIRLSQLYLTCLILYLIIRVTFGDTLGLLALINNVALFLLMPVPLTLLVALWVRQRWFLSGAICMGIVLLLWLRPYYQPKPTIMPTQPTLRVVSFNWMGFYRPLSESVAWLHQQQADLILLQEIPVRYVEQGASEFAAVYPYQTAQPLALRHAGSGILSKHPITTVEYHPTYQRVEILFGEQPLVVYNVHLNQPTGASDGSIVQKILTYDNTKHRADIAALLQAVRQEPHPVIIGGDFNLSDHAPTYFEMAASLNDSFLAVGWGLGKTWPLKNWEDRNRIPAWVPPLLRTSYIWHTDCLRAVDFVIGPRLGSDHLPIYADIELRTAPGSD